jgi:hypothetical protein
MTQEVKGGNKKFYTSKSFIYNGLYTSKDQKFNRIWYLLNWQSRDFLLKGKIIYTWGNGL